MFPLFIASTAIGTILLSISSAVTSFPFAAWRIASVRLAGIPMAAVSSRTAPTSIIGSNSSAYAGISLM